MQLVRVLGVTTIAMALACGSDNKPNGGGNVDAAGSGSGSGQHDAAIDGSGSGSGSGNALGITCTPGTGSDTQGSCPTGFQCLNLTGATNPFCSEPCTPGAGDMCKTGYTGPDLAECILSVTPAGGGSAQTFCDVICEDDTGNKGVCGNTTCDDKCPGSLTCKSPLNNGSGMMVGKACD